MPKHGVSLQLPLRIVITGASGFVGRQIVPLLQGQNTELLLVGRDTTKLKNLFPETKITKYENLARDAAGFDILVHLAVMNNDQSGDLARFRTANVDLLRRVVHAARRAKIETFINPATLHSINKKHATPYSQSKAEGEAVLSGLTDMRVINLRLPAVYGTEFSGKLGVLNKVPKMFRGLIFSVLGALKPTVNVSHIAQAILSSSDPLFPENSILSDRQADNWFYAFCKRTIDLGFCFGVIIVLWWLLAIVWVGIRFSSPGPSIFAQVRVGKNGTPFTCYKFRTMHLGTKQAGTHEIERSAVTSFGKILRRTKIDELPQIWNILKNELSLVGPRPCLPGQTELVKAREIRGVLAVKGGITGWAQIRGVDMSDAERLAALDAQYLALRTIPLDLRIILATAFGRGQGDKVK